MGDFEMILMWLNGLNPMVHLILVIFGTLVVLATAYVKAFPNTTAGTWIAKIEAMPIIGALLNALMAFSVVQRK